jgi:ribosomal protein S18 acetylase RimI-like enzyme
VVNTNEKAINLYKKHGFVQYGILENYFNRGNDSWAQLFMVLTRKDFLTKNR